jgi:hypothetical protein
MKGKPLKEGDFVKRVRPTNSSLADYIMEWKRRERGRTEDETCDCQKLA